MRLQIPKLLKQRCTTGSCAFVGASLAVLADIVQKGEVSAVVKISTATNKFLDLSLPTLGWATVLVAFGVALSYVFDANTKKKAFYLGASIIAIVMTATPYTTPDTPEIVNAETGTRIVPAAYLLHVAGEASGDHMTLRLVLTADAGDEPAAILISIHDVAADKTYQRKEYIAADESKTIQIGLEKSPAPRRIMIRVESDRYQFVTAERIAPAGAGSVDIRLDLKPAKSPVWYRRLTTPYKF